MITTRQQMIFLVDKLFTMYTQYMAFLGFLASDVENNKNVFHTKQEVIEKLCANVFKQNNEEKEGKE